MLTMMNKNFLRKNQWYEFSTLLPNGSNINYIGQFKGIEKVGHTTFLKMLHYTTGMHGLFNTDQISRIIAYIPSKEPDALTLILTES